MRHAGSVVLLVSPASQMVRLAVVGEHRNLPAEPARSKEELDLLVPRHGIISVVVEDQQRGLDLSGIEVGEFSVKRSWYSQGVPPIRRCVFSY